MSSSDETTERQERSRYSEHEQEVLIYAKRVARYVERAIKRQRLDEGALNLAKAKLHKVTRYFANHAASMTQQFVDAVQSDLEKLKESLDRRLVDLQKKIDGVEEEPLAAAISVTGRRGRPSYDIRVDQLENWQSTYHKTSEMARLLKVSERTVKRRLQKAGIDKVNEWTDISDADLVATLRSVLERHPDEGASRIQYHLRTNHNIRISRARTRKLISELNPQGHLRRLQSTIERRKYFVNGPHSLQHIDGNHKLIKWKIVIHAGIDGWSRFVPFLKASTNNRPEAMLNAFRKGVKRVGFPSRVRGDKGGENVLVARWMIEMRGKNRGSFIAGRSVHNVRIERFNRTLNEKQLYKYQQIFHHLREFHHFDRKELWQLYVLHFVYLPRLQHDLDEFRQTHNNSTKTELSGRSPAKAMQQELERNRFYADGVHVFEIEQPRDNGGESIAGLHLFGADDGDDGREERKYSNAVSGRKRRVRVGRVPIPISDEQVAFLESEFPLSQRILSSINESIDIFVRCRESVAEMMDEGQEGSDGSDLSSDETDDSDFDFET